MLILSIDTLYGTNQTADTKALQYLYNRNTACCITIIVRRAIYSSIMLIIK